MLRFESDYSAVPDLFLGFCSEGGSDKENAWVNLSLPLLNMLNTTLNRAAFKSVESFQAM